MGEGRTPDEAEEGISVRRDVHYHEGPEVRCGDDLGTWCIVPQEAILSYDLADPTRNEAGCLGKDVPEILCAQGDCLKMCEVAQVDLCVRNIGARVDGKEADGEELEGSGMFEHVGTLFQAVEGGRPDD